MDELAEPDTLDAHRSGGWGRGRIVGAVAGSLLVALVIVFLIIGLARDHGASRIIDDAVRAGKPYDAPDFTLPVIHPAGRVTGDRLSLSDLRGHPVVLNFWASWCPECPGEAKNLDRIWTRYRDKGVVVLGVNSRDDPDGARAFIREYGLAFPNVREGEDRVARDYGTVQMPETFLIDPDGRIRFLPIRGPIDEAIEQQITAYLDTVVTPAP
mgnify:CR=1 FL=1